VQFDWQWPLMRNSSPLELARSISGWKSLYQPPRPNLSDVAAKRRRRNQDECKNVKKPVAVLNIKKAARHGNLPFAKFFQTALFR
jgi:hypothetical protein